MSGAWFGAGLMGAAFIEALRARGEDFVVWSRTHESALALERFGARAEPDARIAAKGASRIHFSLSDDAAVDELLARLEDALEPGTIVIDHSTVAPPPRRHGSSGWPPAALRFCTRRFSCRRRPSARRKA